MNFQIPTGSSSILNEINTTINNHSINTQNMEVFKNIACKIAMIQNSKSPKITNPTHFIINSKNSLKNYINTKETIDQPENESSLITHFNSYNLLNINSITYENLLNELKYYETDIIKKDTYEKGINEGIKLAEQAYSKKSNCISFGTVCNNHNFSASLLTAEITNTNIKECLFFNSAYTTKEKENILTKILDIKTKHTPMTLADTMCFYGEFDIVIIAGAILKAAELKMVILIDGFIAATALLYAFQLNESVIDYSLFCNQSTNKGQKVIIDYFEKQTILNLDFETNIGIGVPMALPIIESSINWLHNALKA